jgi:type IV secretory pathway TrbF-like protein
MFLILILAQGIVWMSARTKVIPFVVEVDKLGYAITIPTALTVSAQLREPLLIDVKRSTDSQKA